MALVSDLLGWLQGLPEPGLVAATGGLVFAECTIGLGFLAPGESGLLIAAPMLMWTNDQQNAPAAALPAALRDENPLGIWRRVNGEPTREPVRR